MAKIYRVIEIKLNQITVSLRKYPYAYLSDVTVTNIYQSFTYKTAAKIN